MQAIIGAGDCLGDGIAYIPLVPSASVTARIADGVASIPAADWDACAGSANPFVSHAFLATLERSGSVGPGTGWQSLPMVIDGADGAPAAVAPLYAKTHSQGEYVFDQAWAEAWERAGGAYYPKLQLAVPFTPVPGPRLLVRAGEAGALIAAIEAMVRQNELSSAHATFIDEAEIGRFEAAGWLMRSGVQFHWFNEGYHGFEDFLGALSSRKRKAIRRERKEALAGGLEIRHLTGAEIGERHWDAFWAFYQDTGARKWGRPYLTRAFFSMLGEAMGEKLLLILAERSGVPIAGALNLIGADALYGRYWGAREEVPFLHFELCYYQAIDAAIARGLARVEAGAQGEHKLARGYRPVTTWSAHYLPDPRFREAVSEFLVRERAAVAHEQEWLGEMMPFRREG